MWPKYTTKITSPWPRTTNYSVLLETHDSLSFLKDSSSAGKLTSVCVMLYLCSVAFGSKVFPLNVQVNLGNGEPRALQNNCTFIPLFAAALLVRGVFIICGLTATKWYFIKTTETSSASIVSCSNGSTFDKNSIDRTTCYVQFVMKRIGSEVTLPIPLLTLHWYSPTSSWSGFSMCR